MSTIVIAILISIYLSGVHGRSYPEQQDIVTTIKTKQGQVYDCIDFYKQPTFSHPLFKNLTLEKRFQTRKRSKGINVTSIGGCCPSGTVPIMRLSSTSSTNDSKSITMMSSNNDYPDIISAVVRTKVDQNKKFLGAEGSPSTYKPSIPGPNQWSTARMKLLNGPDSIEVGWMVNPSLFHDNEAHLYVKFTAGQNGCINTQCPGFVHVGQGVPLGLIPDHYSSEDKQYTWKFFIDKHDDGNWWVSMDASKYEIGYFPKSLFTGLADVATQVEWGGEVSTQKNVDTIPGMGNGRKASYDTKYAAFYQHITVVNEAHQNVEPDNTEKFETWEPFYNVLDAGNQGEYFGRLILFGGPSPSK